LGLGMGTTREGDQLRGKVPEFQFELYNIKST